MNYVENAIEPDKPGILRDRRRSMKPPNSSHPATCRASSERAIPDLAPRVKTPPKWLPTPGSAGEPADRWEGEFKGLLSAALEAAGVIFVEENGEGPGVRLRKPWGSVPASIPIEELNAENDD
jgi:hypothetical protein